MTKGVVYVVGNDVTEVTSLPSIGASSDLLEVQLSAAKEIRLAS